MQTILRLEISKIRSAIWKKDSKSPLLKEIDKLDSQGIHPATEVNVPKELFMKLSEIQPIPLELEVKQWRNVSRAIKKSDYQHTLINVIEDEIRGIRKVTELVTIYLTQGQINTVEEYL